MYFCMYVQLVSYLQHIFTCIEHTQHTPERVRWSLQHTRRHTHDTPPNKIIGARNRNYALAVCNHLTENVYTYEFEWAEMRIRPPRTPLRTIVPCFIWLFLFIKYGIDVMGDPNPTIGQMKQENKKWNQMEWNR